MEKTQLDNLFRRRQFVASAGEVDVPDGWRRLSMERARLTIAAHPDLALNGASGELNELTLLGYAFDPGRNDSTEDQLLRNLLAAASVEEITSQVSNWAGRFVLFAALPRHTIVLNDACALRSVYYRRTGKDTHLASQPVALPDYEDLPPSPVGQDLSGDNGYAAGHEPWIPSGTSLKASIDHLIPNHYLDLSSLRQIRFYPVSPIRHVSVEDAARETVKHLKAVLQCAAGRFPLALPVTAGWDSRLLLAATARMADLYCYTLLYRDISRGHPDVEIPAAMLASLGLRHHLIDCRIKAPEDFLTASKSSVFLYSEDLSSIAYGIFEGFPQERVALKGNSSEIAREFYPDFVRTTARKIAYAAGWKSLPAFGKALEPWLANAKNTSRSTGWRVLDLFYWEHRMGSWQARSQSEWDIAQEAFTPYNYRPLLAAMLSTRPSARRGRSNRLYTAAIRLLEANLLSWPVNPTSRAELAKDRFRDALRRLHLMGETQYVSDTLKRTLRRTIGSTRRR